MYSCRVLRLQLKRTTISLILAERLDCYFYKIALQVSEIVIALEIKYAAMNIRCRFHASAARFITPFELDFLRTYLTTTHLSFSYPLALQIHDHKEEHRFCRVSLECRASVVNRTRPQHRLNAVPKNSDLKLIINGGGLGAHAAVALFNRLQSAHNICTFQ